MRGVFIGLICFSALREALLTAFPALAGTQPRVFQQIMEERTAPSSEYTAKKIYHAGHSVRTESPTRERKSAIARMAINADTI